MSSLRIVMMGVAGSGKSTLGRTLAGKLNATFLEGDDFQPRANIGKMSRGIPLTDADRWPWLEAIASEIAATATGGRNVVAACSALKRSYRDFLRSVAGDDLVVVMLHGPKELIASRLAGRVDHFMPASLLVSQFETLEWPDPEENPILVDIAQEPRILIADLISLILGCDASGVRPHKQDGISPL